MLRRGRCCPGSARGPTAPSAASWSPPSSRSSGSSTPSGRSRWCRVAGGRAADFGLDVYGKDAGSLASIEATVAETGSAGQVVLHGYAPGAARHFAAASFSLMTSTTEGQSLVLLESMAAGCVPIAYDIRYGPAELLVDGETGFLVPGGDVSALADTIERFLALPIKRVRELRANARERLAAFTDAEVFRRWVERAAGRGRGPGPPAQPHLAAGADLRRRGRGREVPARAPRPR